MAYINTTSDVHYSLWSNSIIAGKNSLYGFIVVKIIMISQYGMLSSVCIMP